MPEPHPEMRPQSLLILEANPRFAARLTGLIAANLPGTPVQHASTLQEGLPLLARGGIDLVLMDLDLPVGALHRIHALDDPAVIIMAGREDEAEALQAIRLGAQDYLIKGEITGFALARAIRYARERKLWQASLTQAEARRRASERVLAGTLDAMRAAIAIADGQGLLIEANAAWKTTDASLVPMIPPWNEGQRDYASFCRAQSAHELAPVAQGFLDVLAGAQERFVRDFQWGAGSSAPGFGITIFSFQVEGERRTGIAIADITVRLATERSLRESQEMLRLISEYAGDLVALITVDGRRIYQNFAYSRALGLTMEELAERDATDLIHPEDRPRIQADLANLFREGKEGISQYRMRHKDGSWRHFEGRAAPVGGKDLAIIVARDITDRVQADIEIMRAHAIKNLILENSNLGIAFVRKRVFEWANHRFGEIMRRPMSELLGVPSRIAYADDASYEEMGRTTYSAMQRGESTDIIWQLQRGDGTTFPCRMIGRPLDPEAPNEGSVWMMEDITERVNAEQERLSLEVQLRHAQKLEAIGQLAAGIAHEINTPTQYIGDNTRFLAEAFEDVFRVMEALDGHAGAEDLERLKEEADLPFLREEIPKAIEQSLEGIARVTKIVRAMKDFSHPGSEDPVDVDLNQAIESTITVSRNEWKYVADLVLDLDPHLGLVLCYPNEMNQAVLNLTVNAAHAIADANQDRPEAKGTITISTARVGNMAEIRVRDTGTGIPEHVRSRIFDPFFTTKAVGKGTGQGLAIVHNVVVERHKGTITFETELGAGSVFILRIPSGKP